MTDRLLATVIELEKTLQEEVRAEEVRAAAWRERELAQLQTDLAAARLEVVRWQEEQAAAAHCAADRAAAELQAAATGRCARLAALPEYFLEKLLKQQLAALLPGVGDDHPHGQD